MKHLLVWSVALILGLTAASCGKKSEEAATPAATGTTSAPSVATDAWSPPADLDQGPRAGTEPAIDASVEPGEKLFKSKGCSACHGFGRRISCPDLDGVAQRRTAKWIRAQILHPDVMTKQDPIARQLFAQFSLQMPKQGLTPTEAEAVIEFLKHKNHEAGEKH